METKDFEKIMSEAPQRADEEKIRMIQEEESPAVAPETAPEAPTKDVVKMSIGQFGATVTGIYTAVSDFVYKRIKKTENAPAWTNADRDAINAAVVPVLEQYNVTLSPLTNLLVTLAVVEAMRYTTTSGPATVEEGGNE